MKNRNCSYDYLRIIACFMVIMNHTINGLMYSCFDDLQTLAITNYLFNSCRMNVVTFIIISGALLLDKQESYKDWFVKRVLRIILVIIIFSALYYEWNSFEDVGIYLQQIFSSNITNAFWYLYLYLVLMLLLPILRKLVESMTKKEYILIFSLFLFFVSIYPIGTRYFALPIIEGHIAAIFSYWVSWIVVFILGHFLKSINLKYTKTTIVILLAIWIIGNTIPTVITCYEITVLEDASLYMDNPLLIWSLASTLALYFLITLLAQKISEKNCVINKYIVKLSGLTFGIYLLSDKLINVTAPYLPELYARFHPVIAILIWDIIVFAVGAIITAVLKIVPFLKKII